MNGVNGVSEETQAEVEGKKCSMKLSYEEYKQMANLMVYYMRHTEEATALEGEID